MTTPTSAQDASIHTAACERATTRFNNGDGTSEHPELAVQRPDQGTTPSMAADELTELGPL